MERGEDGLDHGSSPSAQEASIDSAWRLFANRLLETGERVLQRLHFRQRQQKGQRGFRALILAQPVHMEAVAAAAGAGIIQRQAQIIAAEKPLERAARFRHPEHVAGGVIRLDAGGNGGLRLDGLLVELRAFLAAREKSVRADGPERAGIRSLNFDQPAQRFEAGSSSAALFMQRPLRISACGSLAFAYETTSSNQCHSSLAVSP